MNFGRPWAVALLQAAFLWSMALAAEVDETAASCETARVDALEQRVASLQEEVAQLTDLLRHSIAGSIRRDAHIAKLVSHLAAAGRKTVPDLAGECPDGTMPFRTTTNPAYSVCVHIHPHSADSAVTADGTWGGCDVLRNWAFLLVGVMKVYMAHSNLDRDAAMNLRPRLLFVDVGAHIGMCSMYFAALGDSSWNGSTPDNFPAEFQELPLFDVLAVEPDPFHAAMIRASAAMNQVAGAIRVYERIAWDSTDDYKEFRRFEFLHSAGSYVPPVDGGIFATSQAPVGIQSHEILMADSFKKRVLQLPTATLDSLLEDAHQDQRVVIMKLDVEGQEMNVLRGAQNLFDANLVLLVHFEFAATLRRDGSSGSEILRFFLHNRFLLMCFQECAETIPAFRERQIKEEDVDTFMSMQVDSAFDMAAIHRRAFREDLVHTLPTYFSGLSHIFNSRPVERRWHANLPPGA